MDYKERLMRVPRNTSKLVFLSSLLFLVAACTGIEGEASMQVWLDYPYQDLTVNQGSVLTLMATARDVNGAGIMEIQFFSNGQMIASAVTSTDDPLVSANYQWQPVPGQHTVFARALSASGGAVDSPTVTVTVNSVDQPLQPVPTSEAQPTATLTSTSLTSTLTTTPRTPTVTPSPTTTITRNPTSTATQTLTQRPPEVRLSASPTSLSPGESTTLTWETFNINRVTLDDVDLSNTSGSITVTPVSTSTFVLVGYYPGGSVSDSVTVTVNYNFPSQRYSNYASISVTNGHGSIHQLGDALTICYSFPSISSYLFEFRDYSPASIGANGATGPYAILAEGSMSEAKNVCKTYDMVAPAGYEAFQFRVYKGGQEQAPQLVDFAEIWIYLWP